MLDQIRGRSYEEALMLLEYMPFRACEPVLKTILSVSTLSRRWRLHSAWSRQGLVLHTKTD